MLKSAIILVGGKGSRFSDIKGPPKHLALIQGEPIIIKIINLFRKHDINEIVFPLGYKKNFYKSFFNSLSNQKKYNFSLSKITKKKQVLIKIFDSGLETSKLGRIKKALRFFKNEDFIVTYGDGITNLNLKKLSRQYFRKKNKKLFVSTFYKNSQYGHVNHDAKGQVKKFVEKPILKDPVNIGFYVFNKKTFNLFYKKKYELEKDFLISVIKKKLLCSFLHKGFFYSIDDKKDLVFVQNKLIKL